MPVARPLLIAVLGAVLIAGAFLATRGGGEAPAAPPSASAEAPAAPSGASTRATDGAAGNPDASAESARDAERGFPREVEGALESDKVAVVVLYQPGAADDSATLAAVRDLEAARASASWLRERSAIFTDPITKARDYLGLTQAVGLTRSPAIILMSPGGDARLVEGYTDGRSLRQHLTDALDAERVAR